MSPRRTGFKIAFVSGLVFCLTAAVATGGGFGLLGDDERSGSGMSLDRTERFVERESAAPGEILQRGPVAPASEGKIVPKEGSVIFNLRANLDGSVSVRSGQDINGRPIPPGNYFQGTDGSLTPVGPQGRDVAFQQRGVLQGGPAPAVPGGNNGAVLGGAPDGGNRIVPNGNSLIILPRANADGSVSVQSGQDINGRPIPPGNYFQGTDGSLTPVENRTAILNIDFPR